MQFTRIIHVFLLFGTTLSLWAEFSATLENAEGNEFAVTSREQYVSYNVSSEDYSGTQLSIGDSIITDSETTVEIIVIYQEVSIVVKLAENTTFSIAAMDDVNDLVFHVDYGWILLEFSSLLIDGNIWISGYDTIIRSKGKIFGYNLEYTPSSPDAEYSTTVYSYDGELDVFKFSSPTDFKSEIINYIPFIVPFNTMVATSSAEKSDSLVTTDIDPAITQFWYGLSPEYQEESIVDNSTDINIIRKEKYTTAGKITLGLGIGIITVGTILRAVIPHDVMDIVLASSLIAGGAATLVGGGLLIYTLTLP